jgi:hypothetical protein
MRALRVKLAVVVAVAGGVATTTAATAGGAGAARFVAHLDGYQETPSVSTRAHGTFTARLAPNGRSISWTLSYRRMEGRAVAAHIHFAQRHVAGGISVFLCSNTDASVNPHQECPERRGTISGTIRRADVVGPAGQGIEPGRFAELLRAMRAGATYANVHSTRWPAGEIRGQIVPRRR